MHRYLTLSILWLISLNTLFAAAVTGTVVGPDGKPIAGALLLVLPRYDRTRPQELRSGADGGFTFTVDETRMRPDETYWGNITAYAPGYALAESIFTGEAVHMTLSPSGSLCGLVQDEAGKPLPGVSVGLFSYGSRKTQTYSWVPEAWRARFTSVTDADGQWTLVGMPRDGEVEVAIYDDRYVRKNQTVNIKDGLVASPVRLTARPGATVSGRVFAPDGTPAAGALVDNDHGIQVRTNADGRYRIAGAAPGTYTFTVWSPDQAWLPTTIVNLALTAGKETHVPDVQTQSGAVLEGDALDAETGTPIPWVNIYCTTGVSLAGEHYADSFTTDAQGHFRCHMMPGKILEFSTAPPRGYSDQPETEAIPVEVHDGQTTRFTLKFRKSVALTATIMDEQGAPIAGVSGRLDVSMNNIDRLGQDFKPFLFESDAEGHVRIDGLPPGKHLIKFSPAHPWQSTTMEVTLPNPAPLNVTLQRIPRYTVRGRVLDTKHQPLAGVTAVFDIYKDDEPSEKRHQSTVTTGDDGIYQLSGLLAGTMIELRSVSKPGYRLTDRTLTCKVQYQDPDDLVMMACATTVHGVVRTAAGTPVAGAVVVSVEGGRDYRAVTDAAGVFTLTEQPEGILHLVAATAAGGGLATVTDTTQDAAITFTPAVIAKPGDISLLMSLYDEDAKLPQEQRLFSRADLIHTIAEVDVPLALKMAATEPNQSDGLRAYLLVRLLETDPAQAEKIGAEQLDWMTDDSYRLYAAVELGIAMVKRNPNLAEHCYAIAKAIYDRKKLTPYAFTWIEGLGTVGNVSLRIISLASLLNKTADIDAIIAQVNVLFKQDERAIFYIYPPLFAAAGRVSPEFFLSVFDRLECNKSIVPQFEWVVDSMAQSNPQAARRLLQMVRKDRPILEYQLTRYGEELHVVEALGKTDPTAALEMARELSTHRSEALLIAAQYQPKETAAKILQEFFADEQHITRENLARAIAVDPVFAKSLYEKYAQQLWAEGEHYLYGDQVAHLTMNRFNYADRTAPLDPVEARLIIESSYAKMTVDGQGLDMRAAMTFSRAMCALDVNRALAILRAGIIKRKDDRSLVQSFMHSVITGRH